VSGRRTLGEWLAGIRGLAVTLGVAVILVVGCMLLLSREPLAAVYWFFIGPFTNGYALGNMLNTAVPLVFTGLGISLAFTSSVFNLGGEGQVYAGGLAATAVCLAFPAGNGYLVGLLAIVAGIGVSAVLAGLSGFFRMRWDADEMISSFLVSAAVILVVNFFITGPLDDPANNLLSTYTIGGQYRLLGIFAPSKLNTSAFLALAAAGLAWVFLKRSHTGYEMRICGLNREFARYGGINVSTYLVLPMALSGALHGAAGGLAVMGTYGASIKGFATGMGWNGIAVALIARNNPLAVVPAALLFAWLDAGARSATLHSDVTYEIVAVVQSVIFYLVTAQALWGATRKRRVAR
jgi:ABC-type uncharacterized transport system permease subunit